MRKTTSAQRSGQLGAAARIALLVAATACSRSVDPSARAASERPASPASAAVRPGIDVLLATGAAPLRGLRVGLITNHTAVQAFYGAPREAATAATIDLLHQHPDLDLVTLFSPEHGIHGRAAPGEKVASGRDAKTGLPIHSLYGETQKPTAAMLAGLDALVFDIQDIGTRYYTYVWTMALAMQAAAEHGLRFVVLDRPNPIGGAHVQGNVLDPKFATFVGLYPVPMRHGLTAGELARYLNGEHGVGAELTVVPVEGWQRDLWFDQTGLPWVPPSPNMPSLESALHYPGTCLFEGTNLSVGRGTPIAFQQIGAPWLDHEALARALNGYALPGVRFEATTFTPVNPGDAKYAGEPVRGVRFVATDRDSYDATRAAVAALIEIKRLHPQQLSWRVAHFDRLAGTDRLRTQVEAGASLAEITAPWAAALAQFRRRAEPYLLYR